MPDGLDMSIVDPMNFPRTLLLTVKAPDARYGYKAVRSLVDSLPQECILWCSMAQSETDKDFAFMHQSFPPRAPHWRLKGATAGLLFRFELQAGAIARKIARSAAAFEPQLLWVLSEWGAAQVGLRLRRRLGIPLHITLHDAHETARFFVPKAYCPIYVHALRSLADAAGSMDAVSRELLDHMKRDHPQFSDENCLVLAPGVADDTMRSPSVAGGKHEGRKRRIGFCGTIRTSPEANSTPRPCRTCSREPFGRERLGRR